MATSMMLKSLALMTLLSSGALLPARAEDQKSDLVQIIRQEESPRAAMEVTKLISFNLSPAWWQYMLNRDNKSYHTIRNLADSMCTFAQTYGGDDVTAADTTNDATSPLVEQAIDKAGSKTHCTIELVADVKDSFKEKVIENISMIAAPITEKYYCKPRGGKLNLTITVDPQAKNLRCDVSKDGNSYHFFVPAYADVTTSWVEEALKRGT